MQVLESECYLGRVEDCLFLAESSHLLHILEQLTSWDILHDKVHPQVVLEDKLHLDNEWIVNLEHDQSLKVDTRHRVLVNHDVLAHTLQSIELVEAVMWRVDKVNFAERAAPHN